MKTLKAIKDIIYNNPRADYQEPHMDDALVKQLKKKKNLHPVHRKGKKGNIIL